MHPKHPQAGERRLSFAGLSHYPLALPAKGLGLRRLIDSQCRIYKIVVRPVLETNSIGAMINFARLGAGLTFLPMSSVLRAVKIGAVVAVPMRDREMQKATVDLCVLECRTLPNGIVAFVAALQQAFARSDQ
jgi:DNA-binding transcriptional LysR family regulator